MKYGLSDSEFDFLTKILIEPLKELNAKVYVFGSRAKNKNSKFSDIDLLYVPSGSSPISSSQIYKMLCQVEESPFPYKVDLVCWSDLAESYRANVDKEKIEL